MNRPNILVIHTDQQAVWTVGAHGGTAVATPHIDRLARDGATFTNCHTVSAVCTPSRGCFMTGLYPHQHGVFTNNATRLHLRPRRIPRRARPHGKNLLYRSAYHIPCLMRLPGTIPAGASVERLIT